MSMVTELFGDGVRNWTLSKLKEEVNNLPRVWKERYSYIMHDWARITGTKLTNEDFNDVGGIPQKKSDILKE